MNALYTFSWIDYFIFVFIMAVSASIGIYFGCFGSKQKTISEYIFGGKNMSPLTVGMSIAVGNFSAIALITIPSEVYKYGAYFWFACLGYILMGFISVFIYLPVLFNIKCTSIYEYLELRFDRRTRLLGSYLYFIEELFFLGLSFYVLALILSTAMGIQVQLMTSVICAICIFYTAIGGLRAVVWTDIFQFVVILGSMILILVLGFISSEGVSVIWNKAVEGQRLEIFDFEIDLTKRDSFWTMTLGFSVRWTANICMAQATIQKYSRLPTFCDCIWFVVYYVVFMCTVTSSCVFLGFLLYAKYSECDPFLSNQTQKNEQIVPFYVMQEVGHIPGLFGFFVAALFCASLSSISSDLNATSSVIYRDLLLGHFKMCPNRRNSGILKIIVILVGVVCMVLSLFVHHLGDVLPLLVSISSTTIGPKLGVFTLGILVPKANSKGAFYGGISAFLVLLVTTIPIQFYQYGENFGKFSKPLSIDGCSVSIANYSLIDDFNITTLNKNSTEMPPVIFRISHYYQCLLGAAVTIVVGLAISYFTNENKFELNENLISPLCRSLIPKNTKPKEETLINYNTARSN